MNGTVTGDSARHARLHLEAEVLHCAGDWTVHHLQSIEPELERLVWPEGPVDIDLSAVDRLDTGGAWLLQRLRQRLEAEGRELRWRSVRERHRDLLELVDQTRDRAARPPEAARPGALERLGRRSLAAGERGMGLLAFIGETGLAWARQTLHPSRVRWRMIAHELGEAGHKALGIVGLLSFLLGIVIAYQGGVQLRQYAASLFVADLVGLSMVRELAPLITAIIVAGRTGSAYTAQIGTMQVTEEVDALRSLGIAPLEILVMPKLLALFIALPLLTVYADVMGILGGMVMAAAQLGVSFTTYLDRVSVAISLQSYLVGIGKAPVFALIIATLGCYQGFQVYGSAESVGRRTTLSVVQAIMAVIVVDAAFSVAFSYLGI